MKVTLVYNPKSGSSRTLAQLLTIFNQHDIEISKSIAIKKGFEAEVTIAIETSSHIAVIGGDGTISSVAGLIAGTNTVLIPLPGGTLNHFTKDLGIDQDLETAIANLQKAVPRSIDIGTVNNLFFINNSSIGLYPASLHARRRLEDRLGKWPAALVGSIRALVRYRTYDIMINDQHIKTPFLFVGNNDYKFDKFGPEGRTQLDGGILSVYVLNSRTRWALVRTFAHALVGKLDTLDDFVAFTTTTLTITSRHRYISVSHDGEVSRTRTPITYSLNKAQLTIL
ncbi:MAG: diacylglycerol kinase family protein [Candidatus Saccharimonadales bacterium]